MNRKPLRERVGDHTVASFFLLAFTISWLGFLPSVTGTAEAFGGLNLLIAQFGPAIAGALVLWYTGGSLREWVRRILHWRVPLRWWIATLAIPIVIFGVTSVGFALLGYQPELSRLPDPLTTFLPTLIGLSLIAGLGEEPGWRGFALPRLQAKYGPLGATMVLGSVWAIWHFPLLAVDPRASHGITDPLVLAGMFTLTAIGILLYAFFYTWVYNHTASVLLMMVLHGGFNTATVHLVPFADEIVFGPTYTTLLTLQVGVMLVSVIGLVVLTGGQLGYDAEESQGVQTDIQTSVT